MELLTIGPRHDLLQNVIYALPARACYASFDPVTATIETGNEETITVANAITITGDQTILVGAFIRSTAGACSIILKAV